MTLPRLRACAFWDTWYVGAAIEAGGRLGESTRTLCVFLGPCRLRLEIPLGRRLAPPQGAYVLGDDEFWRELPPELWRKQTGAVEWRVSPLSFSIGAGWWPESRTLPIHLGPLSVNWHR